MVSTIGEEKRYNPRLQVKSVDEYVELMNNLKLPNPKMMDVAVPANMRIGLAQDAVAAKGLALLAADAVALVGRPDVAFVDLREEGERKRHGSIPGTSYQSYIELSDALRSEGRINELSAKKNVIFYCAYGERLAMAVQAAEAAGIKSARHLQGGLAAWKAAGGPLER
jgi:rhodanese-related sulfurtransferase